MKRKRSERAIRTALGWATRMAEDKEYAALVRDDDTGQLEMRNWRTFRDALTELLELRSRRPEDNDEV